MDLLPISNGGYYVQRAHENRIEMDPASFKISPTLIQAAIDIPMDASNVRETLRLAHKATVAKMKADGIVRSQLLTLKISSNEAEIQARDALLLQKGETKPRDFSNRGSH